MPAAGRIAQADPRRAVLDKHTFDRIVTSPNSGWGTDYCSFASFAGIEALTRTATTSPALPNGFTPTATNVPANGLDTDAVKEQMAALAIEFFRAKLARASSGTVGGTVPATLALTLGGPASLGAFVPGVDRTYDGEHHRDGDLDGRLGDALDRRSRSRTRGGWSTARSPSARRCRRARAPRPTRR